MEEALTSMIIAFIEESRVDIGTKPRTLAKILIRYWYGSVVSARYADEPIDAREFVSDFLAVCVQLLHLPAHYSIGHEQMQHLNTLLNHPPMQRHY